MNSLIINGRPHLKGSTALLSACGDDKDRTAEALKTHYGSLCRYLGRKSGGEICAKGIYTREDMEKSTFSQRAYEFGCRI